MDRMIATPLQIADERAKKAGIPAEAVLPYVEDEIEKYPIRVEYEILPLISLMRIIEIADPGSDEIRATWVTFNINHPFVKDVMLDESITPRSHRDAMETLLMIVNGVGVEMDAERRANYLSLGRDLSARLRAATDVMVNTYSRDGFNMLGLAEDRHGWDEG